MRQRGLHAARERLVARVGGQRVEPDHAVRAAAQARHLRPRASPGRRDPSRRTARSTIAPRPIRRPCSRLSSASASPIRVPPDQSATASAARRQRAVGVAAAQLARHARQPRAEHERLDARAGGDARLHVLQQHPRVRRHRARHVAHQHEPARALCAARGSGARAARRRGAATRARCARRSCVVARGAASARVRRERRAAAPRRASRAQQPPRERALGVRVLGEVLLAQQLLLAPRRGRGRRGSAAGASSPCRRARAIRGSAACAISPRSSSGVAASSSAPNTIVERGGEHLEVGARASTARRAARRTPPRATTGRRPPARGARRAARRRRRARRRRASQSGPRDPSRARSTPAAERRGAQTPSSTSSRRARARCPRAPSARRRASPSRSRRRRARAAPAPR